MAKGQPLVYPRQVKGAGPKDYLKITVATEGGQGVYQFFDAGKGKSTGGSAKVPVTQAQASIFLAMPRQLSVAYGMSYQGVDLGSLGSGLVEMAAGISSGDTSENIGTKFAERAKQAMPELALNAAASGANSIIQMAGFSGGVDANSLSALMQGKILNPFREITFRGVNYRNHNFTVKMVARSETEAKEIKNIVNALRYYMHPSLSGGAGGGGSIFEGEVNGGGNNRWLGVPSYFDLSFVRMNEPAGNTNRVKLNSASEIKDIYRPGACVLKSFNVNFSPDGQYVSTPSGYVMAVQITMAFQETVMLHRAALKELNEY